MNIATRYVSRDYLRNGKLNIQGGSISNSGSSSYGGLTGNYLPAISNGDGTYIVDLTNVTFNGNIVATGEVSAYGSGESGGSTGSVTVYDGLDSEAVDVALSANQGRVLKSLIDNIDLSSITVDFSEYYKKSEVNTLIAGYSKIDHIHTMANVTDLQTTLDAKANSTDLATHSENTTIHITKDERSNWDNTYINFNDWFYKDKNGYIHSKYNFIGDSEISAYGAGTSTSGSVGIDIVDALTSTRTDAALSANQGKILKGLIDNFDLSGYYGKSEIDTKLNGKANSLHSHNYLPLSNNGEITVTNTARGVFNLKSTSNQEVGLRLYFGDTNIGGLWYSDPSYTSLSNSGISLYLAKLNANLGISTNGYPYFKIDDTMSTILHSNNYTTYCAKSNHTHNYLSLDGGELNGTITLPANLYEDNYDNGGINMSNSNIYNLNAIYTSDLANTPSEGINFYNTETTVDSLYSNTGILYYTPNRPLGGAGTSYKIWHSGNCTPTDANRLISYYGNSINDDITNRPSSANNIYTDKSVRYYLATSSMITAKPMADGKILHFAWDNSGWNSQLFIPNTTASKIQFRGTKEGSTATDWAEWVSVIDSNGGTINGALTVQNIKLYDNNVIDAINSNNLHINYYSNTNISLCKGGGKVAIGHTLPTEYIDIVNSKVSTNTFVHTKRSDTGYGISFGVGSGGVNRGLYDDNLNRWIIYADATGCNLSKDTWITQDAWANGLNLNRSVAGGGCSIAVWSAGTQIGNFGINGSKQFEFDVVVNGVATSKMTCDSNGNLNCAGEVTAYSDRRLKTNIEPLKVRGGLNPVTYTKDGKQCIGFIADEVKEIYSELVTVDNSTEEKYLSLNYAQLTAVLYAEIKELKERITKLENK